MIQRTIRAAIAFGILIGLAVPVGAQLYADPARRQEYTIVSNQAVEILPRICELAGFEPGPPVPIEVWTRSELRSYVDSIGRATFPEDEWNRMGRALGELGLVPRGYGLQEGFLAFLTEQAGAGYETRKKIYITLLDAPASMKQLSMRRMVIAHELTHALQDRVVDMEALFRRDLENLDRSFAGRSVFEGMASMVMLSVGRGLPLDELPDVGAYMRQTFTRGAGDLVREGRTAPPRLVIAYLFEPYVVGSTFVQEVYAARPGEPLAELLDRMPVSSEQILHVEKYLEGDEPEEIDLTPLTGRLPSGWRAFHSNCLGEHDLRLLGEIHGVPPAEAVRAAEGWDGWRFTAFTNGSDAVAVVGISAWDSAGDAAEFAAMFEPILSDLHGPERFLLRCEGNRVRFVTGLDRGSAAGILDAPFPSP